MKLTKGGKNEASNRLSDTQPADTPSTNEGTARNSKIAGRTAF